MSGGRQGIRALLLRRRRTVAVLALLVPLLPGLFLLGPLLRARTLAASGVVREARAARILEAVDAVRTSERSRVISLLRAADARTAPAVRRLLATAGWEVFPGTFEGAPAPAPFPETFVEGAGREAVAVELAAREGIYLLLGVGVGGGEEGPAVVLLARRSAAGPLALALGADREVGAALYVGGARVTVDRSPLGSLLPFSLDERLVTRVIGEDRPRAVRFGAGGELLGAVVPLKDFEAWDVVGIIAVAAPRAGVTGAGATIGGRLALAMLLLIALALLPVAYSAGAAPPHRWTAALGLLPLAAAAWQYRARLQEAIGTVLAAGPTAVRAAMAEGGLVERFSFGAELVLLAGLVALVLWTALVLLTVWNLERPRTLRAAYTAYGFLTPAIVGLLLFFVGPMIFALYISFHEWSIVEQAKPFVGLGNYAELLRNGDFRHALWITFLYTLHVPVSMALALGLALLLNRPLRGVGVFRTLFFLPSITSFVAIAMVWEWIYNPDFGLANWVLGLFGLSGSGWLSDPGTALLSLMLMAIWIGVGYQMVIFLAGLQSIPQSLYDAATIDGAGPVRRFLRITLPLLRPTTFFVLVTSVIGSFQVFTQVYIMTDGGPVRATDVVVYHIYTAAWDRFRMGEAAAMSWVLFAILLVVTLVLFRFTGRETSYG